MTLSPSSLEPYRPIAPKGSVDFLMRLAERVQGRRFLHVNSTHEGGGVAEILSRLVPMMGELGIKAEWEVITGDPEFYATTKSIHNALQGADQVLTEAMLEHYLDVNRANAERIKPEADLVLIHDPQPAALIQARRPEDKWVWRCHIDLSEPQRRVWAFIRRFVVRYDTALFSLPAFSQELPIPQFLDYPSIDPLSDKNRPLSRKEVWQTVEGLGVPADKPILLQVSRFDRFKDPIGVINAYRMVKPYHDIRLVLAGGGAADDPEANRVLEDVRAAAGRDPDICLLPLSPNAHLQINALQRAATIVIQKSTREGFGLTVTEAMWKGKPVIGGASGGIVVQIIYGVTGYTVTSVEGCAYRIRYLLNNPDLMRRMGEAGREHVRQNFLITRGLRDHLTLLAHLTN
jgi:trehalose synthase